MNRNSKQKFNSKLSNGFTLIELLVVVAIIGMLVSVIMVSMSNSRMKSRDAKRLTDMNQIKSGLDLYYLHGGGYPPPSEWVPGTDLYCGAIYVMRIPQDILSGFTYDYTEDGDSSTGCGTTVYGNYKIRFRTEGQTHLGPGETDYYLHPGGLGATDPF